ncbi:ATP-dependent sacrificial sulfur transferase LarE [Desulfobulbus sp. US1]|nr:ATP-dependent sacrificial sulfur transferase LarE [Desulfobulbus sp. US4]MCW5208884.1 ATP-dependent sacrificial sulfur transferase LarE [Desulfobulbus sp. US1]WLE98219.1 MAG: ATP-dependent sacrificial sulfur transferase LarE [Candidatus Electrothrix communis]
MKNKVEQLRRLLSGFDRVGIAFSGGVDSSFLLRSALDALGQDRVLVLHARSCLQKKQEQKSVDTWAERQGYPAAAIQQRIINIEPLNWADFIANPKNRCYFCKKRLYTLFLKHLHQEGITTLIDGTNADDLHQGETGRPGLQALVELGIRTPLADCRLDKKTIRALSRNLGLDTADLPSSSCLATRLPHGMPITAERLIKVAALEQVLEENSFAGCRVRLNTNAEETVFVQLQKSHLQQFHSDSMRKHIVNQLKKKGVLKIFLDLEGR